MIASSKNYTKNNNNKKQKITSVDEDVEKLEPYTLLVGMQNSAATMENNMEDPENIKNRTTT